MDTENIERIADSWIEMTEKSEDSSDEVFDYGFRLNNLSYDDPETAWKIIILILKKLDAEFFSDAFGNTNINLAANLGSGPLETLLSQHGNEFIERLEETAASDGRMRWILSCVWKNAMSEEVWERVQRAAGQISR